MGTKYTFWKLVTENKIEIPIIQRDYAQGRDEDKVNRIREKFLDTLFKTFNDENDSIDLDFIYGKIIKRKSKKNEDYNLFIPLDGQQRLSTLFLLHWYLATKDNKLNNIRNTLDKFTYETRISSREFSHELVSNNLSFPICKYKMSDIIKNQNWFFESWLKDPTIKSMLVMIDAIHQKFKYADCFFDKLISIDNPPITFQFLNLDDFELTDELYIKMNARGKPLTEFENFKANFVDFIEGIENKAKLDNTWTDLFWKYRDSNNIIDDKYLNFFINITLNFFVEENELPKGTKIDSVNIFDIYETVYSNSENSKRLIKLLDILSSNNIEEISELFEVFIGHKDNNLASESESKLSYWDRVKFHAISKFLIKHGEVTNLNEKIFKRWIRVTFNLINNTLIQSLDNFKDAIRSINKLASNTDDIYNYLSTKPKIDFFLQTQVNEEIIKAILILKTHIWEDKIIGIESHKYFSGQIGFLLNFSGIENYFNQNQNCNWDESDNQYDNLFEKYSNISRLVFDSHGLKLLYGSYIFERALLCKGDYLLSARGNFSFLISKGKLDRDISWKRLLRDDNKSELDNGSFENRRDFVKELFDNLLLCTCENEIISKLEYIISESKCNDWRKYFIKFAAMIEKCGTNKFIRWNNENNILLLEGERTSGVHREYYTYVLYLSLKIQDKKYNTQNSVDLEKSIEANNHEIFWDMGAAKYMLKDDLYNFDEIIDFVENYNVTP